VDKPNRSNAQGQEGADEAELRPRSAEDLSPLGYGVGIGPTQTRARPGRSPVSDTATQDRLYPRQGVRHDSYPDVQGHHYKRHNKSRQLRLVVVTAASAHVEGGDRGSPPRRHYNQACAPETFGVGPILWRRTHR
jgi:hypothetical protein